MSEHFLRYLEREHARLEVLIDKHYRHPRPDDGEIARLKKAKLLIKDQMMSWQADAMEAAA